MKRKYEKPKLLKEELRTEGSITTASLDTEKSVPLVEREIQNCPK